MQRVYIKGASASFNHNRGETLPNYIQQPSQQFPRRDNLCSGSTQAFFATYFCSALKLTTVIMATSDDRSNATPASVPTFKLILRDDIRRWTPAAPLTFDAIVEKVAYLFGFPAAGAVSLKFVDPDGDKVTCGVACATIGDCACLLC